MIADIEIRVGTHEDLDAVATVLADAFFDDPIYRWIVPDDAQRAAGGPRLFRIFADACLTSRGVYRCGDVGGALWVPRGAELVPEAQAEQFGERLAATAGDDDAAARMGAMVELQDEHHPIEPHWYLAFMGIAPTAQRQGLGAAMLRHVLQIVDAEGSAAYLEASSPENERLYQRHGFETIAEISTGDSPILRPMWRDPQS